MHSPIDAGPCDPSSTSHVSRIAPMPWPMAQQNCAHQTRRRSRSGSEMRVVRVASSPDTETAGAKAGRRRFP